MHASNSERKTRILWIALVCVALFNANAAYADRVFDLEGTVKFKAFGQSDTEEVRATLTLFDDGTYTWNDDTGDLSGGIWLEEGKRIQLFQEAPSFSESLAELERELLAEGLDLRVTSVVEKGTIKLTRTGDIRVKAKGFITLRPGPKPNKPLKIAASEKLVGLLR